MAEVRQQEQRQHAGKVQTKVDFLDKSAYRILCPVAGYTVF
jgi:hypothetical protein